MSPISGAPLRRISATKNQGKEVTTMAKKKAMKKKAAKKK
jgi:hypothetical protein